MTWRAYAMTVALTAAGCARPSQPPHLSSDSVAVALFVDLHLAQARQELDLASPGTDSVLASYGLDSVRFARVMGFYARHPEQYEALYAQVVDRLGASEMRSYR